MKRSNEFTFVFTHRRSHWLRCFLSASYSALKGHDFSRAANEAKCCRGFSRDGAEARTLPTHNSEDKNKSNATQK